jgi:hypothetical protein
MKVTGLGPMVSNPKRGQGSLWTAAPAEKGGGDIMDTVYCYFFSHVFFFIHFHQIVIKFVFTC